MANMMCFFWLTFLLFLVGQLLGQESESIFSKCYKLHMPRTAPNPANPMAYCSSLTDKKFTNCLEESMYKSRNKYDMMINININIKDLDKAFKYLCSKFDIMNTQDFSCLSKMMTCIAPQMKAPRLGCFNGLIPCLYQLISTCSPKGAMVFSKVLTMAKSSGCTLSSYQYKLKPFYGPEMQCYPEPPKPSVTAATKLGPNYQQFCAEFKNKEVLQCIKKTLMAKNSSLLLDDDYIYEAKEFARQRSELCEYFSYPTSKTCPSVDILSCQADLFKEDALQKSLFMLSRNYANCVYDGFKTCNIIVAKIIKYNLDGTIRSNAMNLSISFVLRISQAAIILLFFF